MSGDLSLAVVSAVAGALRIDPAKISESTWLIADLKAESIDFLDIGFEIEQATGLKINFRELTKTMADTSTRKSFDLRISDIVLHLQGAGRPS